MADSKVHHDIAAFLELFGSDGDSRENVIEMFLKIKGEKEKRSDLLPLCLTKLDKMSNQRFKPAYEKLKTKNLIELDQLTQLLAQISKNEELCNFFRYHQLFRAKSIKQTSAYAPVSTSSGHKSQTPSSVVDSNRTHQPTQSPESQGKLDEENTSVVANMQIETPNRYKQTPTNESIKVDLHRLERKSLLDSHSFTLDYSARRWDAKATVNPLIEMTVLEQERLLISDLLYVLKGLEGKYIQLQSTSNKRCQLTLTQDCDTLLKTQVNRIISSCAHYSVTVHFTEHHNNCLVNQALNGFLRSNIKDYYEQLAMLATLHVRGELTLQKMWYFLQPHLNNLELMRSVCLKIKQGNCVGGQVLSILHEKTAICTGNLRLYDFCLKMTQSACEPYFRILEHWLNRGIINDPFDEFFIEALENEDDFDWDNSFQVISNRVPLFLQPFVEKILMTGKYISVIRKSSKQPIELPKCDRFTYTGEDRNFHNRIENTYNHVSKMLLEQMLQDHQLLEHLKTIKHYFLMDKSDYIEEFIEVASKELHKEIDDLVPTRLESLLELAIRTSVISNDQHADNLRIEIVNESILSQFYKILNYGSSQEQDDELDDFGELRGYEAVALRYEVSWPLTLILSHNNLKCYQMLFQYLFYCKHIETQLKKVWMLKKNTKVRSRDATLERQNAVIVCCLQKMLNFVQNLEYYMMVEVIEPAFHVFLQKVQGKVANINEMISEHNQFVESVLNSCMMNEKYAFRYVAKLLKLCVSFFSLVKQANNEKKKDKVDEQTIDCIMNLHSEFNCNMKKLLNEIINQQRSNYSANMLHILQKLDYNEFYTEMSFAEEN